MCFQYGTSIKKFNETGKSQKVVFIQISTPNRVQKSERLVLIQENVLGRTAGGTLISLRQDFHVWLSGIKADAL